VAQQYESHLLRINNRPGEKLQMRLILRILKSFPIAAFKEEEECADYRVLEIGPGSGRVAQILLDKGFLYDAIEPTPIMRNNLISKYEAYPNLGKVWSNRMPNFDSELISRYDIIVAFHVLEHMSDQYEAHAFISSCYKMLKPNGHLLIVSPDYRDYRNLFYEIDWSHGFLTSTERIRSILTDVGFEKVVSKGSRAGLTAKALNAAIFVIDRVIPYSILDYLFLRVLGHRLLASGFSVGFLKKNVLAYARK
jgi:2-polyprenyl-3-methyl-5-hydroxy-6-metoxy-1,4-benzoquinol methylase